MSEMTKNYMRLEFASVSANEAFARVAVASFISQLDPTLEELTDIKTVVSEAVTNAIIHGYGSNPGKTVVIETAIADNRVEIAIQDHGVGIENVDEARQPLYTSKPELERSGMGFTIMENFMDSCEIMSAPNAGTTVKLVKYLQASPLLKR
ncbi:anti-sigma F factor [Numidum massiliense]|uniref:anti-sigma F factor n=1 Tax=Numidum massiliense TaxID=1522315 RepID=UPI0006D561D1|nr:anti-sigma F factor [Numidum massiliense]